MQWTSKYFSSAQSGKTYTNTQSLPITFSTFLRSWGTANSMHLLVNGYQTEGLLNAVNFGMKCSGDLTGVTVFLFAIGY